MAALDAPRDARIIGMELDDGLGPRPYIPPKVASSATTSMAAVRWKRITYPLWPENAIDINGLSGVSHACRMRIA